MKWEESMALKGAQICVNYLYGPVVEVFRHDDAFEALKTMFSRAVCPIDTRLSGTGSLIPDLSPRPLPITRLILIYPWGRDQWYCSSLHGCRVSREFHEIRFT